MERISLNESCKKPRVCERVREIEREIERGGEREERERVSER